MEGLVRELEHAALFSTFSTAEQILGDYLIRPKAQVTNFCDRRGKAAGYVDSLDVSWTKPAALTAFEYSLKYATIVGDHPRGWAGPPPVSAATNCGRAGCGGCGASTGGTM